MRKLNNNNSIIFHKFSFRKIHLIPQVFSATKIPQNTPYKNSAFRKVHLPIVFSILRWSKTISVFFDI